ncbi:tetratricopeptide repeat protein [Actinocrinis puniceicyclus]|uniref:Tetratricopeptide repeat protein n=1 Tax=Actinocrinis puniceicyclus TaxID=977794 RepID=A0A8J7WIA9_9ACTN|nr:tetratricopeptide repeat protein [Actinocrinis puniceicyclus]MBS2961818.1 tetratricopeptide repeat protein [Actinocrinis puniceicyclus]
MRPSFSMSGVVDLSALKQPSGPPAGAPQGSAPGSAPQATASQATGQGSASLRPASQGSEYVLDVSEADFQSTVLERSLQVPVVLHVGADWSEQSRQLADLLERLAAEFSGGFVLARVDAEANPRLVQALRVQGVPSVKAIVAGELIGEFSGAQPEAQVRQWVSELLALVQREFGLGGGNTGGAQPAEPPMDPALAAAYDALAADDLDGAARALHNVLSQNPSHPDAKPALAQVELLRRTRDADPAAAMTLAKQNPKDIDAQCAAADAAMATGDADTALALLLAAVRVFTGEERDRARKLLLDYFELLGPQDPRVGPARSRLTTLLF